MASQRSAEKQAFMQFFAYALNQVEFNQMEKDGMLDLYMTAMQFYEKNYGNGDKNRLTSADIEFLLTIQSMAKSGSEIMNELGIDAKTIANRITKSMEKGIICTFFERGTRYYKLTDYGRTRLKEEINALEEI